MKCKGCGQGHPEYQLAFRVKCAQDWYEETNEPTVVILTDRGYDFTTQKDAMKNKYHQVMQIPQGWVQ